MASEGAPFFMNVIHHYKILMRLVQMIHKYSQNKGVNHTT